VSIPMPGGLDSLNASVATGILLFEAAHSRSKEIGNFHNNSALRDQA
jgi:tRNA(Leu) C34 or U34 (ribose-2'-O)-methylase TrmL